MIQKSTIFYGVFTLLAALGGWAAYQKFDKQKQKPLFSTQNPILKSISRSVNTTGYLEIKDNLQVGALVAGTVDTIYVREHEHVKQGQKLALLTLVKGDTDVRNARGEQQKSQATYNYKVKNYLRQQELYKAGFIAQDEFDRITQDYLIAQGDLYAKKALTDKAKIEYENRIIKAPKNGTVISIGVTEGMKTTTDLDATVLFEIAPDTTKMEAVIEIDEIDLGVMVPGLAAEIIADGLPYQTFKGVITNMSYTPCKNKEDRKKNCSSSYQARISIDNNKKLLRPGMSVTAEIKIKKVENTLCINNKAFYINLITLKKIAHALKYSYQEIDAETKNKLKEQHQGGTLKFVWIVKPHAFVETPIWADINDDSHTAIISGVTSTSDVITGLETVNEMEAHYKKWFKTL